MKYLWVLLFTVCGGFSVPSISGSGSNNGFVGAAIYFDSLEDRYDFFLCLREEGKEFFGGYIQLNLDEDIIKAPIRKMSSHGYTVYYVDVPVSLKNPDMQAMISFEMEDNSSGQITGFRVDIYDWIKDENVIKGQENWSFDSACKRSKDIDVWSIKHYEREKIKEQL